MKMEQAEHSERLVFKLQAPGNHPDEGIQLQRNYLLVFIYMTKLHDFYNIFLPRSGPFEVISLHKK
jgi:hypothetical protein